jgi:predicted transposase YdaD
MMKLMVDEDPQAITQFVIHQLYHARGRQPPEEIKILAQLGTEFQATEADADGLLLMRIGAYAPMMLHIEFQSKRDAIMPDRLLDYSLRARRKHGPFPMLSSVIYLRDDGTVQEPPMTWEILDDVRLLDFQYLCLKLWEIPREEILALHQPALLPLSLLTKGEVNRIIVKEMFEELLASKLYDLLPVGQTVASWLLGSTNLEWLQKEYYQMLDFFKDAPAYAWMTESAREEGREEGREEARRQIEQAVEVIREAVVVLVSRCFPKLEHLAKQQILLVKNQERLQRLIFQLSMAQESSEAKELLLELGGEGSTE